MVITRRKGKEQTKISIESRKDLLSYINTYFKLKYPWVGFRNEILFYIDNFIKSDIEISHKKFYINYFNNFKGDHMSSYQIGFWTDRGYTINNAKELIKKEQSKNGLKFSKKIKENPKKYNSRTSTQLGYWLKKGYSNEEAKENVKKRQITFSLEICIKKYGKEKGTEIFNERQRKWLESRKTSFKGNLWL